MLFLPGCRTWQRQDLNPVFRRSPKTACQAMDVHLRCKRVRKRVIILKLIKKKKKTQSVCSLKLFANQLFQVRMKTNSGFKNLFILIPLHAANDSRTSYFKSIKVYAFSNLSSDP